MFAVLLTGGGLATTGSPEEALHGAILLSERPVSALLRYETVLNVMSACLCKCMRARTHALSCQVQTAYTPPMGIR